MYRVNWGEYTKGQGVIALASLILQQFNSLHLLGHWMRHVRVGV